MQELKVYLDILKLRPATGVDVFLNLFWHVLFEGIVPEQRNIKVQTVWQMLMLHYIMSVLFTAP